MYLESSEIYLVTKNYSVWITDFQLTQWCKKYYRKESIENKTAIELLELITQKGHRNLFIKHIIQLGSKKNIKKNDFIS